MTAGDPPWLEWAKKLQAIAQNGLTFAQSVHDEERYGAVREIAADMLARGSGVGIEKIAGLLEGETGYATPKVDVRGAVFREGKILLVRERSDGRWTLPGGWADPCCSPAENVVREVREEAGYEVRAEKVLAVFDRGKHPHVPPFAFHVYKIFLRCELLGGEGEPGVETDAVGFFGPGELPELSVGRTTPWQIARMFEHAANPGWPTDFDRE